MGDSQYSYMAPSAPSVQGCRAVISYHDTESVAVVTHTSRHAAKAVAHMFGLLHGLLTEAFRKTEYKVLVVGIESTGKTSLLEQLKTIFTDRPGLLSHQIVPTVGLNIARFDAHGASLVLWDLGGKCGLRSIWDRYYTVANAVTYVADASVSTADTAFADARATFEDMLANDALIGAPVLVFVNKSDTVTEDEAAAALRIWERAAAVSASDREVLVLLSSARGGEGLQEGIAWLVEMLRRSTRVTDCT